MDIFLRSFVIALFVKEIPCKKCYVFYFKDVSYMVGLSDYLNYTTTVVNKSALNAELYFLKPIADPYWKIEVHSTIRNADIVFLNKTIRYCDFGRLAQYDSMFQNMLVTFRKMTNLDFKCPVCKGYYYIRNLHFESDIFPFNEVFSSKDGFQVIVTAYIKEQRKLN
ncbi:unnamed protein product [Hermetia illucens]|uniref:Uncharacterized protein n=1 Tax=Hermetia illucens TaxID=343691 RepID=A0A7R8UH22_HERIL|nr:unnamed protein product [Hermetia illucens]